MEQLSLFDLNQKIKDTLKKNLVESYWVVAEIGEIRVNQKGHCYLELVEKTDDDIIAKNKATIWSYTYRNLSGWFESLTGQTLKPGLKILSNVVVSYHEVYGLSLNIKDIDASFTIGERAKKRLEILTKLQKEGILEMNKQILLPLVPQRIAVIASSTSAGYQDFITHIENNTSNYKFRISHFQAIMQGTEAEGSIIQAMLDINENIEQYDILVIIRGGGATLDLDCFDTYGLSSHVAQFPIPVITGIGHERDETLTDVVANTSLKTPTAVAEFTISGCREFEERIDNLYLHIIDHVEATFKERKSQLEYLSRHLKYIAESSIRDQTLKLTVLGKNVKNVARGRKEVLETILSGNISSLKSNTAQYISQKWQDLNSLSKNVELVDPKRILKRGYSVTRRNNKIITSSHDLKEGEIMESEFHDGKIESKIIK
jgi:exodeoxyribonuclease VII large subunit